MSTSNLSQKAIDNLDGNDIKLTAPVLCVNTPYTWPIVLGKHESTSLPTPGIVIAKTVRHKVDGAKAVSFVRTELAQKRENAIDA